MSGPLGAGDTGSGGTFYFGDAPSLNGGSKSKSTSRYIIPGDDQFADLGKQFGNFQGGIDLNNPQRDAINGQRQLGLTLDNLMTDYGQGQRNRINQDFQVAADNATGNLASRGFAGSSLNIPAQLGVERERSRAIGELNDQLLGKQIENKKGVANSISDLLFGSSGQATNLISSLLGTGGIGSNSESSSTNSPPNLSGGGGSAADNSSGADWNQHPYNPIFDPAAGYGSGGGGSAGGGGGGSGSGGGGGGGQQVINNPFYEDHPMNGAGNDNPYGYDPAKDGPPALNDSGPLQDPEAFAANQAKLKAYLDYINAKAGSAQGDPLAQSGAGTSAAIAAGGNMA